MIDRRQLQMLVRVWAGKRIIHSYNFLSSQTRTKFSFLFSFAVAIDLN